MPKRLVIASLLILCLIGLGVIVQRKLGGASRATTATESRQQVRSLASVPETSAKAGRVLETIGTLERRAADGQWRSLAANEAISQSDVVRTGPGASARIALGDNVVVDVAESTTLSVAEISGTLSRIVLDDGRVLSKVRSTEGFRFRVAVRSSDVTAETAEGEFGVLRRGEGPVAVAARSGRVDIASSRGQVSVGAGELTVVSRDAAPSKPQRIPPSLFLKLGHAPSVVTRREVELKGLTAPGAVVSLGGVQTAADAAGQFHQRVELKQETNEIVVDVEDVLGRHERAKLPRIVVKLRAPVTGEVKW